MQGEHFKEYRKLYENRRSYTLLPCKSEPWDADGADCRDDKQQAAAYSQRRTTSNVKSGLCRDLSLPGDVCQG